MRILAIRGENLASLSAPFDINLAEEPFASAGLFAITGETGAGKSTILDALCLALYGEYPRVANTPREKVPDPSGDNVSLQDSRSLLRRGASFGFAEVDFLGKDGEICRARWEVRRARNRANGKLQPEIRSLINVRDNTAIATGINPVKEAVIARTDLTFEQFRRTVLLAQGEFDAFLLAGKKERAELLEKITGTEIYAHISKKVFEGQKNRFDALALLRQRQQEIGLLTPEERQAIEDDIARMRDEGIKAEDERKAYEAQLNHAERIEKAKQNLIQAESSLTSAQNAKNNARELYILQENLEKIEPLRPLLNDVNRITGERDADVEAVQIMEAAHNTVLSKSQSAEERFKQAETALDTIKNEIETFTPLWREAERLDYECSIALSALQKASQDVQESRLAFEKRQEQKADLENKLHTDIEAKENIQEYLKRNEKHKILVDNKNIISSLLMRWSSARSNHQKWKDTHANIIDKRAVNLKEECEAKQKLDTCIHEREKHLEVMTALDEQRNALDEQSLAEQEKRMRKAEITLNERLLIAKDFQTAKTAFIKAKNALEASQEKRDQSLQNKEEITTELDRIQAVLLEVSSMADRAEASAGENAAHLRSLLSDGEPCPVCGSLEHPLQAQDHALIALSNELKKRREQINDDFRNAQNKLAQVDAEIKANQDRILQEQEHIAHNDKLIQSYQIAYSNLHSIEDQAEVREIDENSYHVLMEKKRDSVEKSNLLGKKLDQCRELRSRREELQRSYNAAVQQSEMLASGLNNIVNTINSLMLEQTQASSEMSRYYDELSLCEKELIPYLEAADIAVTKLSSDKNNLQETINNIAIQYQSKNNQLLEIEKEINSQTIRLGLMKDQDIDLRKALYIKEKTEADCREEYARKVSQRKTILGGEDTEIHRNTRIELMNQQENTRQTCFEELNSVKNAGIIAFEQFKNARQRCDDCVRRHTEALQCFEGACSGKGIDASFAYELLKIPAAEKDKNNLIIAQLNDDLNKAELSLSNRRSDLLEAQKGYDPTTDKHHLAHEILRLNNALSTLNQSLGAENSKLQNDNQAQLRHSTMRADIEEKVLEMQAWDEVSSAIGSANGDRFRTFVQGITLDQMLVLANEHLKAFSPRYSLIQGKEEDLALHIVDRDMGDAIRGTRSLSGGERFLVSLALALALSGLEGGSTFVDTLFIDEGFGSLDAETLDTAMDVLETLHHSGRKVGVITHVAGMIERIPTQIRIEKRGGGTSIVNSVLNQSAA